MENKIRKIIREQIKQLKEYYVDYYVVYNKSTGEEVTRFQKPPNPRNALRSAEQFIQRRQDDHEKSEKERYERYALMFKDNPEDMDFRPNPKREYEIGSDTKSRSMEEGMSDEEWADAKEAERLANHPEKYKINKIKKMMDKEKSLKEIATKLGYLKEGSKQGDDDWESKVIKGDRPTDDAYWEKQSQEYNEEVDEQGLDQIEMGLNQITGGGRQSASVSDEGDKIRVKFSYARGEFDPEEWNKIINYLEGMGFFILDDSNYYESSYDYEDPPEQVPTIYLKKNESGDFWDEYLRGKLSTKDE